MLPLIKSYHRPSTSSYFIISLAYLTTFSTALRVSPNSPCASVCNSDPDTTDTEDIVCYDQEFSGTTNGSRFQQCVECELGSTVLDTANAATDVLWGLYNLRYAVATCVYGFPEPKTSLSTPCQVTCGGLQPAVDYNIVPTSNDSSSLADLTFCNLPAWSDTVINSCVYCYNWTASERYISNFLQTLHNACKVPPTPGKPFEILATQIFNTAQISAPPTATSQPRAVSPLSGHMALIVGLPVGIGGLIFIITMVMCGLLVRRRRRIQRQDDRMGRVHMHHAGGWAGSPGFAGPGSFYNSPKRAGFAPTTPGMGYGQQQNSPGYARERNSGMGPWAQAMSPLSARAKFGGKDLKPASTGPGGEADRYEGWGQTFQSSPSMPEESTYPHSGGEQLHEKYFPTAARTSGFPVYHDQPTPRIDIHRTSSIPQKEPSVFTFSETDTKNHPFPAPPPSSAKRGWRNSDFKVPIVTAHATEADPPHPPPPPPPPTDHAQIAKAMTLKSFRQHQRDGSDEKRGSGGPGLDYQIQPYSDESPVSSRNSPGTMGDAEEGEEAAAAAGKRTTFRFDEGSGKYVRE